MDLSPHFLCRDTLHDEHPTGQSQSTRAVTPSFVTFEQHMEFDTGAVRRNHALPLFANKEDDTIDTRNNSNNSRFERNSIPNVKVKWNMVPPTVHLMCAVPNRSVWEKGNNTNYQISNSHKRLVFSTAAHGNYYRKLGFDCRHHGLARTIPKLNL